MLITVIAFIVVLSILVLIHELGHFLTARKFGVKVEEFGFGFPPRVWGKKIGETLYSINLLPIGGFVKLYGEDSAGGGSVKHKVESPIADVNRAFFARPAWQRASIVLAGVVMNFVLAVVLISYLFSTSGVAVPTENIRILEVASDSPAEAAGIRKEDEIIKINDQKVREADKFIEIAKKSAGENISLEIKRGDKAFAVNLIPREEVPKGEGPLGIAVTNIEIKKYSWYQAPFFGTLEALKFTLLIVQGISELVGNLILGRGGPLGVAGPIGVAQLTGQAVSYGVAATLWFIALLSLNLAVINILPIPALDGGRLFFIMIELVTRKKVSQKHEALAHAVGLAILLALIMFITFFDVARLLAGESLLPNM